jgi:hypothetical protein
MSESLRLLLGDGDLAWQAHAFALVAAALGEDEGAA